MLLYPDFGKTVKNPSELINMINESLSKADKAFGAAAQCNGWQGSEKSIRMLGSA